jgi:hypothetical protein
MMMMLVMMAMMVGSVLLLERHELNAVVGGGLQQVIDFPDQKSCRNCHSLLPTASELSYT